MKAKRTVAVFACALLCAALFAPAAFAAELTAGKQGKTELQGQAAAESVYVLTEETQILAGEDSTPITRTFSYNKSGLLKRLVWSREGQKTAYGYSYDKSNRLIKSVSDSGMVLTNKYRKQKLIQTTIPHTQGMLVREVYKAAYKSGRIAKKARMYYTKLPDGTTQTNKTIFKFFYNKKGLISKYGPTGFMNAYKYDAHGNFVQITSNGHATKYKNQYDSEGNLVKRTELYEAGHVLTSTYSYKKVEVKNAVAKKVEQQQWSLLNGDLNNALDLQD